MAEIAGNLSEIDNYAQLQQFLLKNLPDVIAYFRKSAIPKITDEQQKFWTIDALDRELRRIQQEYGALLLADDLDIKPVRGDATETTTYKEEYSKLLEQKRVLQQQFKVKLLNQLLQQKFKVDEAKEAVGFSPCSWANGYEKDDDEDETKRSNEKLLGERKKVLDNLCKEALADEEIRAYVTMRVAEEIKKQSMNGVRLSARTKI